MSERITEAGLREMEDAIAKHASRDPEGYRTEQPNVSAKLLANVVVEVRRLRGVIVAAMTNPYAPVGETDVEAEARAIREEQDLTT